MDLSIEMVEKMDFTMLSDVYLLAREKAVGFSLHFCEADNTWFFTVDSCAPTEDFEGKSRDFTTAVDDVLEHLNGL